MYRNYDTSPEKVWMICFKLLGNFLKRFQNPGLIVNRSIQLICLKHIKKKIDENCGICIISLKEAGAEGMKCEPTSKHKPLRGRS